VMPALARPTPPATLLRTNVLRFMVSLDNRNDGTTPLLFRRPPKVKLNGILFFVTRPVNKPG
jgi:hypothetical protein